jgi:hypothetical protein
MLPSEMDSPRARLPAEVTTGRLDRKALLAGEQEAAAPLEDLPARSFRST